MQDIVYREIRDGNGPTRVGFVAYWRRDNDNPALAQFVARLKAHLRYRPRAMRCCSEDRQDSVAMELAEFRGRR